MKDIELEISVGKWRKDTQWKNVTYTWSDFINRLSTTKRTDETVAEYNKESKTRQAEIKDVGGFVGGIVSGGRRLKGKVAWRSMLTLDVDYAEPDFWSRFTLIYGCTACIYSTHKHTPKNPRVRLIIPLDRLVMADEYEAIGRKVAENIGIDEFDDTTYQAERLMYWPSTPKDGEYLFEVQEGEILRADDVLTEYFDWSDVSQWPLSSRVAEVIRSEQGKQVDPLEKEGVIGAFCRTYSISEAIDKFLPDCYESCANDDNRYTYKLGSTAAGAVVYDDKFLYSHHSTDPCCEKLVNAFDLCRIHLFGDKDKDAKEGTNATKLPSFIAMSKLASEDPSVRKLLHSENIASAEKSFEGIDFSEMDAEAGSLISEDYSDDWLSELKTNKNGDIEITIDNVLRILQNDKYIGKKFAMDLFEKREVSLGNLPWRKVAKDNRELTDRDDAYIRHYLETKYKIPGTSKAIKDAMVISCNVNAVHPIKSYLEGLKWDGVERLDSMFHTYLGAADDEYHRTLSRKMAVAAVARIFRPGCKFDNVVTFVGSQGMGKSTFVANLGMQWFTDSFGTVQGREALESVQGVWIIEVAELAGMKKAEREQIKHFMSKKDDRYRVAYGTRVEKFPRQCIFIATTNEDEFLEDPTGNRRFWIVECYIENAEKSIFDDMPKEVDQLWAEAMVRYREGETLFLSPKMHYEADRVQKEHFIKDSRTRVVKRLLDMPVPKGWKEMDKHDRFDYINTGTYEGTPIDKATPEYIWTYAFRKDVSDMTRTSTAEIQKIMSTFSEWERKVVKFSGVSVRGYARKNNLKEEEQV